MDISELRDCTAERLIELGKNLRKEIFEARIKNYTNQLDDTASIRRARRDLARVLTVLNERPDGYVVEPRDAAPDSAESRDAAPDSAESSDAAPDSAPEPDADADDDDEGTKG